ncbi:MAG: leucine-rich repeat domain-containing protein, partial [Oscillospiraceae bacterium]|nr:leucine-rich repeat domain-containing protein [Oscillospiraceae bacterium]
MGKFIVILSAVILMQSNIAAYPFNDTDVHTAEVTVSEAAASPTVTIGGEKYPATQKELYLSGCSLTDSDITAISGMTELRVLDLSNNRIGDLSLLSGLTKLEKLSVYGNYISDITPLAQLDSLCELNLGENYIRDISALEGMKSLTGLNLNG